jgi:hypothetical protein
MEPNNIRFGGGSADTILHPLVAIALLVAIGFILFLPRKHVTIPSLLLVFLVPFGQVLVVAGVHFTVYRILIIAVLFRLLVVNDFGGESRIAGGFDIGDRLVVIFGVTLLVTFWLQWRDIQALIKGLGSLLDLLGGYFALRCLVRDTEDIERVVKIFAVLAMILSVCMVNEQLTHRNVFGLLGGIPLEVAVREGKARSTGAFEVYITAGVFGATLIPLFVWLWSRSRAKMLAIAGFAGATAITMTSNSSTPLLAYASGIVGLAFWPLRAHMRTFRRSLVALLVGLHVVMKAPVWALIARVDLTGSSSGYHRYMLVDGCIRHFADWWLMGTKDYDSWGWDMWDLSNQYVAYALTGGIVALVTFILIITKAYSRLGNTRKSLAGDADGKWLLWCLGAALTAHVVGYFGIGYFDQMQFAWYALLAMISVAVVPVRHSSPVPAREQPVALLYSHPSEW